MFSLACAKTFIIGSCCRSSPLSKVHHYTVTQGGTYSLLDGHFRHIHSDLVHPPSSFTQAFTCVGRFTRWSHAVPVKETSSESAVQAFMEMRFASFVPETVTLTGGSQFTSISFRSLLRMLGCEHIHKTAYHSVPSNVSTTSWRLSLWPCHQPSGCSDYH